MKSFGGLISIPALAFVLSAGMPADALAQRFSDPDVLAPSYPTPDSVVEQMLTIAQLRAGETVYDLGCGEGRIVIAAAQKFKAHAVGVEIRRDIYDKAVANVASLGLGDQVRLIHGNMLKTDLSPADVVTLYLLTSANERLKPILMKDLKPTARVVSHDFEIQGWKPATVSKVMVGGRPHMIYLYRISDTK